MGKKRYSERTTKESAFPLHKDEMFDYYKTETRDNETGKTGRGTDRDRGRSIEKSWKDLREKQGK